MSKKSHHFLTLWPWPLTYDLEKLIRSGHYHYQCVYQIWGQSIPWFLSYRVNTIAGGGRLWRKTITSPDPSDTEDIINSASQQYSQLSVVLIPHFGGQTTFWYPFIQNFCDLHRRPQCQPQGLSPHIMLLTAGTHTSCVEIQHLTHWHLEDGAVIIKS